MRAVLDPNVIISGWLSPRGGPAAILTAWRRGSFELIVSPALLRELERALAYPKLRRRIPAELANDAVQWLFDAATVASDPEDDPPVRSSDEADDYLIALAAARRALLVSGDKHLLKLAGRIPVYAPADFLKAIS